MEKTLAESLLEISQEIYEDCGIMTYSVPYLPGRVYIEATGIAEIQNIMKFSTYGHLVSRAARILDDLDRNFLRGTSIPVVPCPGSWVRIIQAGIYKGDLALVLFTPNEGDVVLIVVVPRFNVSEFQNKKRKGSGLLARAAPAPALLDPTFLANFPLNENNIHSIGSRVFHRSGLEVLRAPSAHTLKIEPRPSEAEIFLFQSCVERLHVTYTTETLIRCAVNKALRDCSRRFWHTGDRVRVVEGVFKETTCFIHEIDEANQIITVEFSSPPPTRFEVSIDHLERIFLVGDQVRVALGKNKGRTGSILEITDGVGTIVESTANELIEVTPLSILLHLLIILPSYKCYYYILRAIPKDLLLQPLLIRLLHP